MDMNAAMIFVQVVRSGSFTQAAKHLRLPNSTVSDRVADLERTLGVSLLVRTTRQLRLTEPGAAFFKKAEVAISSLIGAGEEASAFQSHPSGILKITAAADFDQQAMSAAIAECRDKFPEVEVEIHFTDRNVDLIGEGFDLAIRVGHLKDSALVAKRVGTLSLVLVASPKYLKSAPQLRVPKDLNKHKSIKFVSDADANLLAVWNLVSSQGRKTKVHPNAKLASNSCSAIWHLVAAGAGIALLPKMLVSNEYSKDRMVRVFPDWSAVPRPVHLVYPSFKVSSPKLMAFIPILEPRLRRVIQ